jgi:hypothetical protein
MDTKVSPHKSVGRSYKLDKGDKSNEGNRSFKQCSIGVC